MTERSTSSGTLLDGMAAVAYGDTSQLSIRESRKRDLQQMIEVIWCTLVNFLHLGLVLNASWFV